MNQDPETKEENIDENIDDTTTVSTPTIDDLSGRVDDLIKKMEGLQKSPEEPEKIKSLTDKIEKLEAQITKMVESGTYNPDKSLQDGKQNISPVNKPEPTINPDVPIFNSLRDMDFNITDDDINK